MLTTQERQRADAYKLGFLTKLSQLGVSPDILYLAVKQASLDAISKGVADAAKDIKETGSDTLSTLARALVAAGLVGPAVIGGGIGAAEAFLNAPTEANLKLVKKVKELENYQQLARELQARREANRKSL